MSVLFVTVQRMSQILNVRIQHTRTCLCCACYITVQCVTDARRETVAYSRTCLSFLVGQNDVTFSRHCRGGVVLKLMDECAGIVAAKHCRTNVVTACLNATTFYKMIKIGGYRFPTRLHSQ